MYENFTKQYPLSKTLRFELKPVGETAHYIQERDIIEQDQQRAEDYKEIKEIIDDYHRVYIEEKLSAPVDPKTGEMWITPEDFENAFSDYQRLKEDQKNTKNRGHWEDTQTALRKKLVKSFVGNGDLFKKELITRDLPAWLKQKGEWEEHKTTVENFNKFTTYFSGFHENRKNMYSDKDQSTAIAYRLMNGNLPRFFNNCIAYQKITEKYTHLELQIDAELLSTMGVESLDKIFQPQYFINLFAQSGIDNYQQLLGGKTEESGEKKQGLNEQINLFRQRVQKAAKQVAKDENKKAKKIYDLSGFTDLYKQILSDRETTSFVPEAFDNDKDFLGALAKFIELANTQEGLLENLENAVKKLEEADTQRVYVKAAGLTAISQNLFSSYRIVSAALDDYAGNNLKTKKQQEDYLKQKVFSIAGLDEILCEYIDRLEQDDPLHEQLAKLSNPQQPIYSYFLEAINTQKNTIGLGKTIAQVKPLLSLEELSKNRKLPKSEDDKGGKGFQQVQAIQKMLEAFMAISHTLKPLHLLDGRKPIDMPDMDTGFYAVFSKAYEAYNEHTITLYNKTRNHLTKKPFSTDKIKINFNNSTLLNGWDANKETADSRRCGCRLRPTLNFYCCRYSVSQRKSFEV